MKKLLPFFMIIVLFALTACASQPQGSETGSAQETSRSNLAGRSISAPEKPSLEEKEPKILVAYFSRSGNTEQIANIIHTNVGGDLFPIQTAESYPESYDEILAAAREEQARDARPELANSVEYMNDYDAIFLGYPIWWGEAPMAVLSFLDSYDLAGKQIIPFCTYGSSGFGDSVERLERLAPACVFLEGFGIEGSQAEGAGEDVLAWLNQLGFKES